MKRTDLFVSQGYYPFISSLKTDNQTAFEKCIWEGETRKYFIYFYEWDWSKYPAYKGSRYTYSSEVQYNTHGVDTFDCAHARKVETIEDILFLENFYEQVYQRMEVPPYSVTS